MREELEQDILTSARDNPSDASAQLITRHPREEVMEAIEELTQEGFLLSYRSEALMGPWFDIMSLTERGEALLHDLEYAE